MNNNYMIYKDSSKPINERIEDLLTRMTLDEKILQMQGMWSFPFINNKGVNEPIMQHLLNKGLGQVCWMGSLHSPTATVSFCNQIQKYAVEETRLGIPLIFHCESLAGMMVEGATSFPQAIGLASTWEPELIYEMGTTIKHQLISYGVRQALSPVLDVARDPRWGRIGETYGEDPYLVSQMGKAYISGLQGSNLEDGVIATAKHFLGYAACEGGKNRARLNIGKRELVDVYAKPFEAAIKDCKLGSIMNAYQEIDGVPVVTSKEILTDLLRGQLGFEGTVVADYYTTNHLVENNRVAKNPVLGAIDSIEAGLDIEFPQAFVYGDALKEAVQNKQVDESLINQAVKRLLKSKFELGLFENPYSKGDITTTINNSENKRLAQKIAAKSITLLKNENNVLPLSKHLSSIAVIGPSADSIRNMFGDYTTVGMSEGTTEMEMMLEQGHADPDNPTMSAMMQMMGPYIDKLKKVKANPNKDYYAKSMYPDSMSIFDAVKNIVSDTTEVYYAVGCDIIDDHLDHINEAVKVAQKADVAIVVVGGIEGTSGQATSGENRDRAGIHLMGAQQKLIEEIYKTGTQMVLILLNGRPLAIPWAAEHIPSILEAWAPGERGGYAIADILFGDESPGGKLPITIPRSVGQIPIYYGQKPFHPQMNRLSNYIERDQNQPLYPFGHGLSYTQFKYTDLVIENKQIDSKSSVVLSFKVKNVGKYAGDEVAQIYLHDKEARVTRPVKELVGFKRMHLKKGEEKKLSVEIDLSQLAFTDRDFETVVEPGNIEVFIGSSSADIRLQDTFEIVGEVNKVNSIKKYTADIEII